MPQYEVSVPGKGTFSVNSPTELTDQQVWLAVQRQLELPEPPAPPPPAEGGFFPSVKRGFLQTQMLVGDVLPAMLGKAVGAEDYAKKQWEEAAETQKRIEREVPAAVPSYKDISNFGDAWVYAKEAVGESLASIIPSLLTGGAAGLVARPAVAAANTAAREAAEKTLMSAAMNMGPPTQVALEKAKQAAVQAGIDAAKRTAFRYEAAGGFAGSALQNIPEVYQNIKEETGKEDIPAALVAGGFNAALDSILPVQILKKIRGQGLSETEVMSAWYKRGAKGLGKGFLVEGATEAAQEGSSILAENFVAENSDVFNGKNLERVINAGLKGGLGGGVITAATDIATGKAPPQEQTDRQKIEQLQREILGDVSAARAEQTLQEAEAAKKATEDAEAARKEAERAPTTPEIVAIAQGENGYTALELEKQRLINLPKKTKEVRGAIDVIKELQQRLTVEEITRRAPSVPPVMDDKTIRSLGFVKSDKETSVYRQLLGKSAADEDVVNFLENYAETKAKPQTKERINKFLGRIERAQIPLTAEEAARGEERAGETVTEPSGAGAPVVSEPGAGAPAAGVGVPQPSGVVPPVAPVGEPPVGEGAAPAPVAPSPVAPPVAPPAPPPAAPPPPVAPPVAPPPAPVAPPVAPPVEAPAPAAQVTFPPVTAITNFRVGPGGVIAPRVIAQDQPLYRETNREGLEDILRYEQQADYKPMFVTDDKTLALGQGENKGVLVTFRPNSLSGKENAKPGTGVVGGREYQTDLIAPRSVMSVEMPAKDFGKLRPLVKRALTQFTRNELPDGRLQFVRKGLEEQAPVAAPVSAEPAAAPAEAPPTTITAEQLIGFGVKKTQPMIRRIAGKNMAVPADRALVFAELNKYINNKDNSPESKENLTKFRDQFEEVGRTVTVAPTKKRKPQQTVMESALLGRINMVGGLDLSLLSEFSEKKEIGVIGKNDRPLTRWINPMTDKGKLFRSGGMQDYGEIARVLEEAGYMEPGSVQKDPTEAGERAKRMILSALKKEDAGQTIGEMEEDTRRRQEELAKMEQEEFDAENRAEIEAERRAIMEAEGLTPADLDVLEDNVNFLTGATEHTPERLAADMRAMGFTEQEIEDAVAEFSRKAVAAPAPEARAEEAAQAPAAPEAVEELELEAPTAEEIAAREKREADAREAEREEQRRLERKQKADAERGEFVLTGSDRPADVAEAAGQMSIFGKPSLPEAAPPKPVKLSKETQAKIDELSKLMQKMLGKMGLKNVALNLAQDLERNGEYANRLITLALDATNPVRDLRHESLHAMKELGFFSDAQWATLTKMARDKWIDKYLKSRQSVYNGQAMSRYDAYMRLYNGNEDLIIEEAIADAFGDFDATKAPPGFLQTMLFRMREFFRNIREAMGAANIDSAEDIFRRVEKGELRETAPAVEAPAKASLRAPETEAFKRWFGDSKVVDAEGKPLVVYHATTGNFTEFKPGGLDPTMSGPAMWFTDSKENQPAMHNIASRASGFRGGTNVMPVYLKMERPLVIDDKGMLEWAREVFAGGSREFPELMPKKWADEVRRGGEYDGIIFDGPAIGMKDAVREYIVFEPTQIKSATGNIGTYDATKPDIRYSLRDQDTEAFKKWSGSAPVVRLGEAHEYRSGQPVVAEALHGTTNADITEFKRSKANVESDFGAGFYASNTPEDVAINYANVEGADLTRRVETLAERIAADPEFEGDMDEATAEARKRLSQGAPNTMKLYMRFKSPAVLGGKGETFFDYNPSYNEETDEYGEPTGLLVDFVNALDDIGDGLDISMRDLENAKTALMEAAGDGDGLKLSELAEIVKDKFSDTFSVDGDAANGEVLRQALERVGFDGVIDTSAYAKFGPRLIRGAYSMIKTQGMAGLYKDTVHFVAFKPTQIKSATGNIGTYDATKPDIRYSLRDVPLSTRGLMEVQPIVAMQELGLKTDAVRKPGGIELFNDVRSIALALNQETIRNHGQIAKTDTSLTSEKELARAMVDEIGYQLRATADTGTGKGWYSDNYPKAVKKLGKLFPELETNPYARTVFSALVAITSNGEKVSLNVKNAIKLYEDIRMGKDPRDIGSRRKNALDNNVAVVMQLMQQYGPAGMRNELLREITVKDMNAILRARGEKPDTSYLADAKVPAAALYFGPKLGAFFSNLEGAEGYLTMDMWWTRTVNRMRGQLESRATEASIKKFAEMMDKPNATRDEVVAATIPLRNKYEEFGWHTELEELVGSKEPAEDKNKPAWTAKAKRKAGSAYQGLLFEHRLEKMANTIYKNEYEMLQELPFTAGDREFMYRTARRAQSLLKAEGINLSLADIQAALWYYEKRLYQHLSGRKADDIGYDEAITQLARESTGPARPSVVFAGQPVPGAGPTGAGAAATGVGGKPAKPSLRDASWSDQRIDTLLDKYSYLQDGREKDTKAYAAFVRPEDFLAATTTVNYRQQLEREKTPLNVERLAKENQEIFLDIKTTEDEGVYQITGHEGRHRMMALRDAGVRSVPVVFYTGGTKNAEPVEEPYFRPQEYSGDKGAIKSLRGFSAMEMIPISWDQRTNIAETFGGKADVRFSLRDIPRANLRDQVDLKIVQRMDQLTVQREEKGFVKRITDAISPKNFGFFRQQALNRYEGLSRADRMKIEKMGGADILADASAESAALMSDMGAGITASALGVHDREGGAPVYKRYFVVEVNGRALGKQYTTKASADAAAAAVNGVVRERGFTTVSNFDGTVKGPVAILAPLMEKHKDPEALRLFQLYSMIKRGARLMYTQDNKGNIIEKLITADDVNNVFPRLEAQFPEFKKAHAEWIKYNDKLVDFMRDTGIISEQNAATFKMHGDYFPFYRQIDGDEDAIGPRIFQSIAAVKAPKKMKGSEIAVGDFLENMVRNTQSAVQAGIKNVASRRAAQIGMDVGIVEEIPIGTTPEAFNSFYVLENGLKKYYGTHDQLFIESIKSLNLPDMPFIGMLAGPANLLRNLVTKDPGFILANLMRDSLSAWATSGVKMTPLVDTMRNFGTALASDSPEFKALLNAGVIGGYEFSQNVQTSAEEFGAAIRKAAGVPTLTEKIASPVTSVWGALEKATTASDAATRMEIYKRTLAETGNEAEALYRALEVMNFNRKGSSAVIRILTAAVPFLNARMQGLDILYRASIAPTVRGDTSERARQIQKTFFVRGAYLMALSAMYWLLTHDDEEYKKQEQETRDNYWLLPSLGIKIPIPFEVGVLFKVIPERILAYTFGDDTGRDFLQSMKRQLLSTLAFNPIPQTVLPAVETVTNFSFFTWRPIIPQGLENVAPEYQVGPGTSKLAEGIGKTLNLSPMRIDQLINGYTGTMGMYAVDLIDAIYNTMADSPKPSKRFEQMPVIRRFAVDPEARGTVTAYYDLKNAVDQVVRTENLLERTMDYENWGPYMQENMKLLASKDYVSDMEKTLKELREMKTMIRSSTMSADAKRDSITQINRMENALTANIQQLKKMFRE